jgi:hypothetical protein
VRSRPAWCGTASTDVPGGPRVTRCKTGDAGPGSSTCAVRLSPRCPRTSSPWALRLRATNPDPRPARPTGRGTHP